ncbi:MAG: hypothetical protein AB1589_24140 [Cyanobacteriota bacterium]
MRQASLITWVSILALFVGGCQTGDNGEQTGGNTPSPTPVASPIQPKPAPSAAPFGSKPPLVAQQPGTTTTVPGLIPPVPPDDVIKRINKGRVDPFTAVPVQPEVTVSPNPSAPRAPSARPVPQIPQLPRLRQPNGGASGNQAPRTRTQTPGTRTQAPGTRTQAPGTRTQARRSTNGQASRAATPSKVVPPPRSLPKPGATQAPKPNGTTNTPKPGPGGSLPGGPVATAPQLIPELPPLPEPTQARGIEVSGVVEVGNTPVAIVKVPNEPARYVREGQLLANGQVLVKRIEMNRGPTPVVILEQYGVEVARGVGEAPATGPGQPVQGPTASLPVAPSL